LRFHAAGGWSGADSLARSILAVRREPVVLVVDADGGTETAMEREAFLLESLGAVGRRELFEVVVFTPALEVLLFQDDAFLGRIARRLPTEVERVRAEYDPKRVLEALEVRRDEIAGNLRHADIDLLRSAPEIQRIVSFLNRWIDRSHPAKVAV
jgi:hypothetical protein